MNCRVRVNGFLRQTAALVGGVGVGVGKLFLDGRVRLPYESRTVLPQHFTISTAVPVRRSSWFGGNSSRGGSAEGSAGAATARSNSAQRSTTFSACGLIYG